ncbi:MAG: hypothetical protein RMM98_08345 [Acidobacteriota bacterium]|nr:hypothetical protein [Blastocatellia bacterium]MDW8239611.1 hypothetical protein [Acidobacteriota bacterium]
MKAFFRSPRLLTPKRVGIWLPIVVMLGISIDQLVERTGLAQVKRVTLSEMVTASGTVVSGRVVQVREGRHPHYRNIAVTFVTVEVEEVLKGAASHITRHEFMQFGGTGITRIHDIPSYQVGEEVMLFLYPESEQGFTSPVGGGQGKFYLKRDSQTGERWVSQALPNASLFDGIKMQKLTMAERELIGRAGSAMNYRAFSSLVRKLAQQQ